MHLNRLLKLSTNTVSLDLRTDVQFPIKDKSKQSCITINYSVLNMYGIIEYQAQKILLQVIRGKPAQYRNE